MMKKMMYPKLVEEYQCKYTYVPTFLKGVFQQQLVYILNTSVIDKNSSIKWILKSDERFTINPEKGKRQNNSKNTLKSLSLRRLLKALTELHSSKCGSSSFDILA